MSRLKLHPVGAFAWVLACAVLAAAFYAGYREVPDLRWFTLEGIRVEGAQRTGPEAVLDAAALSRGTGLFAIDVDRVRQRVERLPWVRSCRVVRQLPSTLTLKVAEWAPRYLVRLDRLYYLTREAHVVAAPLDQGLDFCVVTGLSRAQLDADGPVRDGLLRLMGLLDRGVLEEEVGEIHVDPQQGFTLYTPAHGGTGIRLGLADLEERFDRLARLRRHLGRRAQAAYAINLAAEDRIVARLLPGPGKGRAR
ncbi:MAG: hypothetical protein Kow0092_11960 [Deferrisomatales bacterium]